MSNYYYIDLSLKLHHYDHEISPEYFKRNIIVAVNQLFGEVASNVDIDIIKYNSYTRRAVLRVPSDYYVKIRSSLTLCNSFQGDNCTYIIHKASPLLLNLQGDSRNYTY